MTLSDRIAAGDTSQEVVEAVARALGWEQSEITDPVIGVEKLWQREGVVRMLPNYITDIRLVMEEAFKRSFSVSMEAGKDFAIVDMRPSGRVLRVVRPDANLTLAAITALLRALGE